MKTKTHDDQARAFVRSLIGSGWISINQFSDGGHLFELLGKGQRTVLVQIYPSGHGFNVWKPITESNTLTETRLATEAYGNEEVEA